MAGLLAAWVALAGCGDPTTLRLDAGAPDASTSEPTGRLELEGATSLALAPGERAEFAARWVTTDGRPIVMRDVAFALDGAARDSTLASLGARTDADGRVFGTVIAGGESSTFRVRISASGATPVYLDVAVSADGFGRLVVTVEDGGSRDIAQRTVMVHQPSASGAVVSCEDALTRREADRSRTTDAERVAVFTTLPAVQRFTVVARATSAASIIVAEGCVADVALEAGRETRVSLPLVPRTLGVEGEYDAELALSAGTAPRTVADALALAIEAGLEGEAADAVLWLDALAAQLRDRGALPALAILEARRASGDAERELGTRLSADGASLAGGVRSVLDELVGLYESVRVEGLLFVAGSAAGPVASFTRGAVRIGAADPVVVDLRSLDVMARAPAVVRWSAADDVLMLDAMRIELPAGTLLLGALDAVARARGLDDGGVLIAVRGGCETLHEWAAEQVELDGVCGAECVDAACRTAGGAVMTRARTAAVPLDALRARVVLSGALESEDADGNLTVDALRAEALTGAWRSVDGLSDEPVDASFGGERISPLP